MTTTTGTQIPLWLDCDTGHDDAYALLLSAHDPRVHLLGVSTVHGNAALDQTTFNTRSILEAIGQRHVKVYPGAAKPIERDAVHAPDIHGESGLGGVSLLNMAQPIEATATDIDFLEAMYKALVTTSPNSAWLVSTGALTNLALLFQKYPDLASHLKGLSIMGGAVGGGFTNAPLGHVKGEGERFGNWTAYAEFNIYCDPEASYFIFSHPVLKSKTTLITLDLSHQVLGTKEIRHALLYGTNETATDPLATSDRIPSTLRALFAQTMSFFATTYANVFSITEGPPLHDPLAVAVVIDPGGFDDKGGERFLVDVVTDGIHSTIPSEVRELGRTKITRLPPGEGGCRIPRGLNLTRFWVSIEEAMGRAENHSPLPTLSREYLEKEGVFVGID